MPRSEFGRPVKREALKRAGGRCEAIGEVYGLAPGERCNALLSHGVEFDHYPLPATDKGSDTLDNCVAACKVCHSHKTRTYDVPMQAKNKRMSDRHLGIRPPSRIRSAGFGKAAPQRSATREIIRKSERIDP